MRNDPDAQSKFVMMYEGGVPKKEIMERLALTDKGVDYWRRKLQLTPRATMPRPVPEGFVEMATQRNMTVNRLSAIYQYHNNGIMRWLKEVGVTLIPSRNKLLPDDWFEVVGTLNASQLSKHYCVDIGVIRRWLKETGTKPAAYKPAGRKMFRLPQMRQSLPAKVQSDEASQAAHYLRRFYANVFRCDIMFDDKHTWGEVRGLPNKGRGLYHVDKIGIVANTAVIELAEKKGWRTSHVELDS